VVLAPLEEVDDFAVAQSTPLPECIAGFEGDTGGDIYAEGFGISILIPKNFHHESFEAEETAKELTIKAAKAQAAEAKAAEAKDEAKAEPMAKKSAAVKLAGTKQKIKKQAATDIKQKTAAAPAKEDAKRCNVSFPGALVVLVSAALFFAVTMALQSNSSVSTGAPAEVVTTKSISSWANSQQCGLYENDDFCAVQEAFETTCSADIVPDDGAKGFGHSASLDATATERDGDGLRKKKEGVAAPLQWMPVVLGFQVGHSGSRVLLPRPAPTSQKVRPSEPTQTTVVFQQTRLPAARMSHDLYGFTTDPSELTPEESNRRDEFQILKGEIFLMHLKIKQRPDVADAFIERVFVEFNNTNSVNTTGMDTITAAITNWRSTTGDKIDEYLSDENYLGAAQIAAGAAEVASAVWSWAPGINLLVTTVAIATTAAAIGLQYDVDEYEKSIVSYIQNGQSHVLEYDGMQQVKTWQDAFTQNSLDISSLNFASQSSARPMLYAIIAEMVNHSIPMTISNFKDTLNKKVEHLDKYDKIVDEYIIILSQHNNVTQVGNFTKALDEVTALLPPTERQLLTTSFAGFAAMGAVADTKLGYGIYKSLAAGYEIGYQIMLGEDGEVAVGLSEAYVEGFAATRSIAARAAQGFAGFAMIGLAIFQIVEANIIADKLVANADNMTFALTKYYTDVVNAARPSPPNQVLDDSVSDDSPPLHFPPLLLADVVGTYECHLYDGTQNKNDWHYVTIMAGGSRLRWSNRAGVSWMLTPRADGNLDVGEECPYYKNEHTVCQVVRNSADSVTSLLGPWGEAYDRVPLPFPALNGQFKIKHTPIHGAPGVSLSCHQTVRPGDTRGGDSQYVHCNIKDYGDLWTLEHVGGTDKFRIKHTPIHGAPGVFLSCHQTVRPGDTRGGDSQYVHCNIKDWGDLWTLEHVGGTDKFRIKHTPIHGAPGVFLSCHQTVRPGDTRGGDSQYVHCNIKDWGDLWTLEKVEPPALPMMFAAAKNVVEPEPVMMFAAAKNVAEPEPVMREVAADMDMAEPVMFAAAENVGEPAGFASTEGGEGGSGDGGTATTTTTTTTTSTTTTTTATTTTSPTGGGGGDDGGGGGGERYD